MCRKTTRVLQLAVAVLLLAARLAQTHQMLAQPLSVTKQNRCSDFFNCKNQICPTGFPRKDVNPLNPPLVLRRGQVLNIRVLRNNHNYGFARYSLVPVAKMQVASAHTFGAFHFTCGDTGERKCEAWNRKRDCLFDRQGKYNQHRLTVPTHVKDGVYVLGWVWFGSLFEDSRDCTFVRIRGGKTVTSTATAVFQAAGSVTGHDSKCLATADRPGPCNDASCLGFAGRRKLALRVPYEWRNGRAPRKIPSHRVQPYQPARASVRVTALLLVDADRPSVVKYRVPGWQRSLGTKRLCLRGFRPAVVCQTRGKVAMVQFLKDGWRYHNADRVAPYDMENSPGDGAKFTPLKFDYDEEFFTVACRVYGADGSEAWKTMAISTEGRC